MSIGCCLWCHAPFQPRSDGGRVQRYCSPACRRAFDGAARAWVRRAVGSEALSLADLQKAPPATRALATRALAPDKLGASLPACFGAGFSTRASRDIGQI
jgi:hypothetical protein